MSETTAELIAKLRNAANGQYHAFERNRLYTEAANALQKLSDEMNTKPAEGERKADAGSGTMANAIGGETSGGQGEDKPGTADDDEAGESGGVGGA